MAFRLQKPPIGARLNLADPIARGLIVAAPFNEGAGSPVNSVNARRSVPTGSLAWGSTQLGTARVNKTSASDGDSFAIAPYNVRGPITVEVACVIYAFPTNNLTTLWDLGSQADSLYIQNSSGYTFIDFRLGSIDCHGSGNSTNLFIGQPCVIHGTYDNATLRCYKNGVPLYSQAATPAQMGTNVSGMMYSFGGAAGYTSAIASLDRAFVWTRPLSEAEIAERVADPWGIYRRPSAPKFVSLVAHPVSAADSSVLTDSSSLNAFYMSVDSCLMTDSQSIAASLLNLDTASLVDSAGTTASLLNLDTASLIDSAGTSASVLNLDAATLVDSASLGAFLSNLDTASLVDSASLVAFLSALVSASLIDASTATASLASIDSAGLTDIGTLGLLLAVLDAAGLSETVVVDVLTAAADFASYDDFATIAELVFALDSAGLIDSASLNRNLPTCLVGYASFVQGAPDPRFTKVTNL
jgi:hypothetical protein